MMSASTRWGHGAVGNGGIVRKRFAGIGSSQNNFFIVNIVCKYVLRKLNI